MHKRHNLEELELLDLQKCNSVGDIVSGLSKCSFGARCLGDTTNSLQKIIESHNKSTIVYCGSKYDKLGYLVQKFAKDFDFELMTPREYANLRTTSKKEPKNLVVIGRFSEEDDSNLFTGESRTIFINKERLVEPHQTMDGYFPDVVFSDPKYIMPIIDATIRERLQGQKISTTELITSMREYGGLATEVLRGSENFLRIVKDPSYTIFMTMSGAMTIAQMSYVLCDMIDQEMIQSLTTTGAAMAHGLVESMGFKHYKYNPKISDTTLMREKLNRVTDSLEPEENFDHIDEIMEAVLNDLPRNRAISPSEFHARIGKYLHTNFSNERGILKSAYEKDIPVFVPAFYDSEIGNDITTYNMLQEQQDKKKIKFDLEKDNHKLIQMVQDAKRTGLFTIGGGVPRNWTQNVAPLIEIINGRTDLNLIERPFSSGVKTAPDAMDLGHLGGCTYSEGMSWRKMDPNGLFVEIHGDATLVWPFVTKYVMENRNYKTK